LQLSQMSQSMMFRTKRRYNRKTIICLWFHDSESEINVLVVMRWFCYE
jgi:hypothetical protein